MATFKSTYGLLLRGCLLACWLFVAVVRVPAQEAPAETTADEPEVTYEIDQAGETQTDGKYDYREFSAARLREFKEQRAFQYDEAEEPDEPLEPRRYREEPQRSSASQPSGGSANWVVILLIFAVVVALLMLAMGLKPSFLFGRKSSKVDNEAPEDTPLEDIHHIKFETELEKAIRLGNYRLAVRIQYLETLKRLSDRGLIRWLPNKTNWEYAGELQDAAQRQHFKQITQAFEYAWYGEFTVDEPVFRLMRDNMQAFQNKL